ncbi:hypothetical protein BC939DRAFT_435776 [Gamsiella multidivaricata]|uniref:uncharacterized protein n=1 Tax=Gamsiella multidivaricata TaxID=101098 RepID=UPI00221E8372|nr:uncharacterized protein BC939DRAFT_435776 [Gamsiella multidivaricata]KAI7831619.1 hypothetical protein BC939DRAFT_435776 [Gamsiella multidivaricata]
MTGTAKIGKTSLPGPQERSSSAATTPGTVPPTPSANAQPNPTQQGAAGFRLQSLLKLRDVRSADNKSNLIHYLANMVAKTNPELLSLPEEFAFLSKLEQHRTKEILDQVLDHQKAIKKLRDFRRRLAGKVETLTKAIQEAAKISKKQENSIEGDEDGDQKKTQGPPVDADVAQKEELETARQVLIKLDKFLSKAQTRFEDLVDLVETLDYSWKSTAIYFGEKTAADMAGMPSVPSYSTASGPSTSTRTRVNNFGPSSSQRQQQQQMVNKMQTGPRKPPEEIFAVIHEFLRYFREAHLQNEDAQTRANRQAAAAAAAALRSSASSSASSASRRSSASGGKSLSSTLSLRGAHARP